MGKRGEKLGLGDKNINSDGSFDDSSNLRQRPSLVSLFPQRGTVDKEDSKWRDVFSALSDFFNVPALVAKIGVLLGWGAGVGYFIVYTYWDWTPLIVWVSSGFSIALWLNIRSHSHFGVEKERMKTRKA